MRDEIFVKAVSVNAPFPVHLSEHTLCTCMTVNVDAPKLKDVGIVRKTLIQHRQFTPTNSTIPINTDSYADQAIHASGIPDQNRFDLPTFGSKLSWISAQWMTDLLLRRGSLQ